MPCHVEQEEDDAIARMREEWRQGMDDKQKMVRAHNAEKAELLAETRALRKALNPATEQV